MLLRKQASTLQKSTSGAACLSRERAPVSPHPTALQGLNQVEHSCRKERWRWCQLRPWPGGLLQRLLQCRHSAAREKMSTRPAREDKYTLFILHRTLAELIAH